MDILEYKRLVFKLAIEGKKLTTQNMKTVGINLSIIKKLMELGVIERTSPGNYKIISMEDLLEYAEYLHIKKEYAPSEKAYYLCYEIDPNNIYVCDRLLTISIKHQDYDTAFKCIDVLYNSNDNNLLRDLNFYLYLLSNVTIVPDRYLEKVNNIGYEDFKYPELDEVSSLINKIRWFSYTKSFIKATKLAKSFSDTYYVDDDIVITKALLWGASLEHERIRNQIYAYASNNDYVSALNFLDTLSKHRRLSKSEYFASVLIRRLLSIRESKKIYQIYIYETDNIFEAIKGNNFRLALKLTEKYKDSNQAPLFACILKDICNEIDSILLDRQVITLDDIKKALINRDKNNLLKYLKKHLTKINKLEYYEIIIYLIRLDILYNDLTFSNSLEYLSNLNNEDFNSNINHYIRLFYESISNKNVKLARIYLNIIIKLSEITHQQASIDTMELLLANTRQEVNRINEENEKKQIERQNYLADLINKNVDELYANDELAFVLEELSKEDEDVVYQIVGNYKDVLVFTIGSNNPRLVIKRQRVTDKTNADYANIKDKALNAYKCGRYNDCIILLNLILKDAYLPNIDMAYNFKLLGYANFKLNREKDALTYFIIANGLFEKYGIESNLNNLISSLNEKIICSNIDIDKVSEIAKLIAGSGKTVHEACIMFKLDGETEDLINLYLARDSYINEKYDLGDMYLSSVKSSNEQIKTLVDEIRRKKFIYKNSNGLGYKPLVKTEDTTI